MAVLENDLRLSVLDTSPIVEGSTARQALHNTVDLARAADALGYHRYWVPEHHGMRGVASAAPAVLVARIADATSGLRVGSGGVLLPNHAPLVVAEQFGTLEALHPGRIDLGIGRAPGGNTRAVAAVRKVTPERGDFADQLAELLGYFDVAEPGTAAAIPAVGNRPDVWLLGQSSTSARLAGANGLPYAIAHHLNPDCLEQVRTYEESFRPSAATPEPRVLISVAAIAAESDARAERLAGSTRLKTLSRLRGSRIRLPTPEAAAEVTWTQDERAEVAHRTRGLLTGTPESIRQQLDVLLSKTRVRELMVTTPVHDHDDRRRSYELLAGLLRKSAGPGAPAAGRP